MLKIFGNYRINVTLILVLLLSSVLTAPFASKRLSIGTFSMPVTPILVLIPILLGIAYAMIVSNERPKMPDEKKKKNALINAIMFIIAYAVQIATIIYSFR